MDKLGIEYLNDKQRLAICFHQREGCLCFLHTGYGKPLTYVLLPYAFDTASLDSLQTRPCNFFLFFLATTTHTAGSHHICKFLQESDNAMTCSSLTVHSSLISRFSIATRLPSTSGGFALCHLIRPFLSLGEVKGRAT